jgi:hypothetical protein
LGFRLSLKAAPHFVEDLVRAAKKEAVVEVGVYMEEEEEAVVSTELVAVAARASTTPR